MNTTNPSDTPRTDAAVKKSLESQHKFIGRIGVDFCRELERELSQWRACAEKFNDHSGHWTTCPILVGTEWCNCGLNEVREMFEKLKVPK